MPPDCITISRVPRLAVAIQQLKDTMDCQGDVLRTHTGLSGGCTKGHILDCQGNVLRTHTGLSGGCTKDTYWIVRGMY